MAPGSPEIGDPALLGWRPIRGRRLAPVTLDAEERRLLAFFLRRYVRWCARSRHHDRVAGALHSIDASVSNGIGGDHGDRLRVGRGFTAGPTSIHTGA